MTVSIVDTNVVLVANSAHDDVSPECVIECTNRLNKLMQSGVIAIDDQFRILLEYQRKTTPRRAKGVGDIFVKWVLQNVARNDRVHQVPLTEEDPDSFLEFPDSDLALEFDAADRKFVAVANAHPEKPAVWQAADCKWLHWWPKLLACGVRVEFLCGEDVCRFYRTKYPDRDVPALP